MSMRNVINQLRLLPVFNGNVAGAAQFKGLQDYTSPNLPVAFVVPLEDEATENESMTGTYQIVTERIGVVVIMSNAAGVYEGDRRGQFVAEQYDQVKFSIFKAILNWNPFSLIENPTEPDHTEPVIGHAIRGYYYEGCQPVDYDLSRIVYQFTFGIQVTITDDDGWQADGVPLDEITFTVKDAITGDTLAYDELDNLQA